MSSIDERIERLLKLVEELRELCRLREQRRLLLFRQVEDLASRSRSLYEKASKVFENLKPPPSLGASPKLRWEELLRLKEELSNYVELLNGEMLEELSSQRKLSLTLMPLIGSSSTMLFLSDVIAKKVKESPTYLKLLAELLKELGSPLTMAEVGKLLEIVEKPKDWEEYVSRIEEAKRLMSRLSSDELRASRTALLVLHGAYRIEATRPSLISSLEPSDPRRRFIELFVRGKKSNKEL